MLYKDTFDGTNYNSKLAVMISFGINFLPLSPNRKSDFVRAFS